MTWAALIYADFVVINWLIVPTFTDRYAHCECGCDELSVCSIHSLEPALAVHSS